MLQSKKANFVIALILAVALWMYVVGEKNPDTTREYKNIPITLTNTEVLDEDDLAVASANPEQLNVKLSGSRSVMAKVEAEDITAKVDVSQAGLGTNELKIHLKVPGNTYVSEQSITEVTVKVEQRVTDTKPVEVRYKGKTESGVEPSLIGVDPEEVVVAGVESQVSAVAAAQATVKVSRVGDSESSVNCTLVPVDKNGKEVENVTLSQTKATVSSILYYTREVPLDVPIIGESDEKYERSVDVPETITVKGDSALLEQVEGITADQVDISTVTEDKKIKINPQFPDGILPASGSEELFVTVKVEPLVSTKTVTLDPSSIGISGVGDGLSAEIVSDDISVTLTGNSEAVEAADADSVSASCDVSGLKEGTHKVDLKVSSTAKNVQIDDRTAKVEVKLTGNGESSGKSSGKSSEKSSGKSAAEEPEEDTSETEAANTDETGDTAAAEDSGTTENTDNTEQETTE